MADSSLKRTPSEYRHGPGQGTEPHQLVIEGWSTCCGDCGYGRGGWASSPANYGLPILTPESRVCHGCGVHFTHSLSVYTGERIPFDVEKAA